MQKTSFTTINYTKGRDWLGGYGLVWPRGCSVLLLGSLCPEFGLSERVQNEAPGLAPLIYYIYISIFNFYLYNHHCFAPLDLYLLFTSVHP
jgi:hypothetical protein